MRLRVCVCMYCGVFVMFVVNEHVYWWPADADSAQTAVAERFHWHQLSVYIVCWQVCYIVCHCHSPLTDIGHLWQVCLLRHVRREWALLSFHSVCLSVWMSVGHSATYSLPRLIDHNQIWSAGPRTRVSLLDPLSPILSVTEGKISPISNTSTVGILATANVTHRAIWLVIIVIITRNAS